MNILITTKPNKCAANVGGTIKIQQEKCSVHDDKPLSGAMNNNLMFLLKKVVFTGHLDISHLHDMIFIRYNHDNSTTSNNKI